MRVLAIAYADFFRGVPTILVIALLGFGAPALAIEGVPTSTTFWGVVSLVLIYTAYVSEVYRAGIESVHPSQEAAARSLGLTRGQALRLGRAAAGRAPRDPAAPERLHRAAEGHGARRRSSASVEAFKQAQIEVVGRLQLHATTSSRRRSSSRSRSRSRASPTGSSRATGASGRPGASCERRRDRRTSRKSFGKNEVLRGIDLDVAEHEVVCLIGASGSGKSTLLRCVNLLEPVDAGRIVVGGEEITARGVDVNRIRRGIGIVFQAYNLFPHMTVLENVTLGPRKALGLSRREAEAAGDRAARALRARRASATTTPTGSRAASSSASRSSARSRCGRS